MEYSTKIKYYITRKYAFLNCTNKFLVGVLNMKRTYLEPFFLGFPDKHHSFVLNCREGVGVVPSALITR